MRNILKVEAYWTITDSTNNKGKGAENQQASEGEEEENDSKVEKELRFLRSHLVVVSGGLVITNTTQKADKVAHENAEQDQSAGKAKVLSKKG